MPEVRLVVRNLAPVAWGNNEWEWRAALASEARSKVPTTDLTHVTPSTKFTVDVIFMMTAARIQRADLDNLAKPILDTLFRISYPQVRDLNLTAALFPVDDNRVFKLSLEKREVSSPADEGVEITAAWK